jgi:hypothetical protein
MSVAHDMTPPNLTDSTGRELGLNWPGGTLLLPSWLGVRGKIYRISDFRILADDDPVFAWFLRCGELFDGLGRKAPGYY